ncbi:hypothetical protein GO730_20775 [Spirosoma sp. HMF3257]|uniref:Uncharacterized protein n=1 Tax=Spirosoma telluris TaxID=2183553 RepID=A0A327NLA4_9BACT|nr:hypothetical protein [Spirosoma telluris]RAI75982.1 hypothetical protein HMF3257_20695 [Spirosoma telluris]
MNLLTALNPRPVIALTGAGKGNTLPKKATITVPASLDWVIRRRIVNVWQQLKKDEYASETSEADLAMLHFAFGPYEHTADYQLTLHGFQWMTLFSFLQEQTDWYFLWSSDVIPALMQKSIHDELKAFISDLERLCVGVDVFASRPIEGNG